MVCYRKQIARQHSSMSNGVSIRNSFTIFFGLLRSHPHVIGDLVNPVKILFTYFGHLRNFVSLCHTLWVYMLGSQKFESVGPHPLGVECDTQETRISHGWLGCRIWLLLVKWSSICTDNRRKHWVPHVPLSRSLEVTESDMDRSGAYDFVFMIWAYNAHFRDKRRYFP